jgi:hypothetical protein
LERLKHERSIALGYALEPASVASYSSALHSYVTFCTLHSFPVEPTPDTLSFFIVFMCHHIKPQSVQAYLSGICSQLEPFFPAVREVRKHRLVTKTLAGCKKFHAVSTTRKLPLSRPDLAVVGMAYRQSPSFDDCLFITQLFVGFHALLRLGELVWPDKLALQDYRKVVLRHTVNIHPSAFTFHLPGHKADKFFEGNLVMVHKTNTADDPFAPFTHYLHLRDRRFPFHPHLWLRADGSIPTRRWFINRLRRHFPNTIGGHSLRAGGATALADAGVSTHIIQAVGRWSSDAFKIYIRRHPTLLAGFLYSNRFA